MTNREKIDSLINLFMDEMDKLGFLCVVGGIETKTDNLISMSNTSSVVDLLEIVCYMNALSSTMVADKAELAPQAIAADIFDTTLDMIEEMANNELQGPEVEMAAKLVVAKKKNNDLN